MLCSQALAVLLITHAASQFPTGNQYTSRKKRISALNKVRSSQSHDDNSVSQNLSLATFGSKTKSGSATNHPLLQRRAAAGCNAKLAFGVDSFIGIQCA